MAEFTEVNSLRSVISLLGVFSLLAFGVIAQTHFQFRNMTAFDLITILVLLVGGIGLFLSSLRGDKSAA